MKFMHMPTTKCRTERHPVSDSFLVPHRTDHRNRVNGSDSKQLGIAEQNRDRTNGEKGTFSFVSVKGKYPGCHVAVGSQKWVPAETFEGRSGMG